MRYFFESNPYKLKSIEFKQDARDFASSKDFNVFKNKPAAVADLVNVFELLSKGERINRMQYINLYRFMQRHPGLKDDFIKLFTTEQKNQSPEETEEEE